MFLERKLRTSLILNPNSEKLIWALLAIYINLWVVEGAIRKWIPGTEQFFYVLRDSIALLGLLAIVFFGKTAAQRSFTVLVTLLLLLAFVGMQIILVPTNPLIAVIGLRNYLGPMLFAGTVFVYPKKIFAIRASQIIVRYAPFQMLLVIFQVLSSPESFINKLVSSDQAYFVNDGIVRATGTFSAPSGLSLYGSISFALSLWKFQRPARKNVPGDIILLISSMAIISLSGSRSALLSAGVILIIFFTMQIRHSSRQGIRALFATALLLFMALFVVFQMFPHVIDSFNSRLVTAASSEDSVGRIWGDATGFMTQPFSYLGSGAGVNSQSGIGLGSTGVWIEVDSLRWVAELGLLGWVMALIRLGFGVCLVTKLIFRGPRVQMFYAMVAAALLPSALYGAITQNPTTQGFFSICLGLLILAPESPGRMSTILSSPGQHQIKDYSPFV